MGITEFTELLSKHDYCHESISQLLAKAEHARHLDMGFLRNALSDDSAFSLLFRFFILAEKFPESEFTKKISGFDPAKLAELGLLKSEDGTLTPLVKLLPFQNALIAADFDFEVMGKTPEDYVMGVSPASLTLICMTPRMKVEKALDLGTGGGIQAFVLSQHCEKVIGTDICDRALGFAKLNAKLNEVDNIEWRPGSFFEPVAGEKFDLITANPPFVISPESKFTFRDGDFEGDGVSQHVLSDLSNYLNEGAFASILFTWGHSNEADWMHRPFSWLEENSCDACLFRTKVQDSLTYAANWLRTTMNIEDPLYSEKLREWHEYYNRLGFQYFSVGAMLLRRRSKSTNWYESFDLGEGAGVGTASDQILRIFAGADLLNSTKAPEELLHHKLKLANGNKIDRSFNFNQGTWISNHGTLKATQGISLKSDIDFPSATLLEKCESSNNLKDAIRQTAKVYEIDTKTAEDYFLDQVISWIKLGFMTAEDEPELSS